MLGARHAQLRDLREALGSDVKYWTYQRSAKHEKIRVLRDPEDVLDDEHKDDNVEDTFDGLLGQVETVYPEWVEGYSVIECTRSMRANTKMEVLEQCIQHMVDGTFKADNNIVRVVRVDPPYVHVQVLPPLYGAHAFQTTFRQACVRDPDESVESVALVAVSESDEETPLDLYVAELVLKPHAMLDNQVQITLTVVAKTSLLDDVPTQNMMAVKLAMNLLGPYTRHIQESLRVES